jgi:hypothetical protein
MADQPDEGRNAQELARRNRLAKALRDNLKRRKSQSRGRAGPADAPEPDPAPADRSRHPEPDA